ncbi:MAG: hypothetical protein ABI687_06815 [Flavitalea sp.]
MKTACIAFAALTLAFSWPAEDIDYKKIFGSDYTWAVSWLQKNDSLISAVAASFHVPPKELKSIVFPELIRYNKVFDAIQIESLKYLYVTEGKTYANFSVGYFQMKPSFAESVEREQSRLFEYTTGRIDEEGRRERVQRLVNTREQLIYLSAFYKICEKKFADIKFTSADEKLKLFATCYNAGFHRSYESLLAMQHKKQFLNYNYSDISLYYFNKE